MHRDADGARLVGDRARDGLADPPRGVGRELVAAAVFELVHRLHQADVAFLDQVEELQAAVGVFLGDRDDQTQVGFGHLALGAAGLGFAGGHLLVDVLEFLQRDADVVLQVDQLLLLFLDRRGIADQRLGIGALARGDFGVDPVQVHLVAREDLDEVGRGIMRTLSTQICWILRSQPRTDSTMPRTESHRRSMVRGKADVQQFFRNLLLQLEVGLVLRTLLDQCVVAPLA